MVCSYKNLAAQSSWSWLVIDNETSSPDRWNYRWNIVALTLVIQSISVGILIYGFALFVVPWVDEFGARRRDVMLAIMLSQIATGALSPFAGRAMDRFGLRGLVVIGATLIGIGLSLVSLATTFWHIIVLYALVLPAGMVLCGTLASQTLVTRWFIRNRGMAMGISAIGTSLGGLIYPPIVDVLILELGWREAMRVLGGCAIVVILPLAWWILRREPEIAQPPSNSPSVTRPPLPYWRTADVFRTSMFWLPVLAFLPLNAGFGAVQFNLGAYTEDLGYGASSAALLISITSFAMILGKLLFGTLGDRVDHRYLYWLAAVSLGFALLAFQYAPSYSRMIGGALLLGLATGASLPLMAVIYASRFGALAFGRVMGLAQAFFMLGAAGPLMAGWVFDVTGSYDPAFMALLILLIPLAVALRWLPPAAVETREPSG